MSEFGADQKLLLVLGLEHGGDLLEVGAVTLFLQRGREEDGDDALCDVGQVEVIVALHHPVHHTVHTETPARARGGTIRREPTKKTETEGEREKDRGASGEPARWRNKRGSTGMNRVREMVAERSGRRKKMNRNEIGRAHV